MTSVADFRHMNRQSSLSGRLVYLVILDTHSAHRRQIGRPILAVSKPADRWIFMSPKKESEIICRF